MRNRWYPNGGIEIRRKRCQKIIGEFTKTDIEQREGNIPNDWRTSIIITLYKRGDKEITSNYRGIFLLCSAYKIYAEVVRNRIEK